MSWKFVLFLVPARNRRLTWCRSIWNIFEAFVTSRHATIGYFCNTTIFLLSLCFFTKPSTIAVSPLFLINSKLLSSWHCDEVVDWLGAKVLLVGDWLGAKVLLVGDLLGAKVLLVGDWLGAKVLLDFGYSWHNLSNNWSTNMLIFFERNLLYSRHLSFYKLNRALARNMTSDQ